ncbi:MAG: ABC transporter ATP-binding protein [Spirochaetaceae bacterium]|nr:ABC transporter ATP-binding protein [Spirochaetaceae bacterium]
MSVVCSASNISFSYTPKRKILQNISFSTKDGEIIGILGKNGSGKSTLLNIVAGLSKHYEGDIFLEDKNIKDVSLQERAQRISYVQQTKLYIPKYYSVEDFVIEGRRPFSRLGFYKLEDYSLLDEILTFCYLNDFRQKLLCEMSGGEMQRAVFSRAIIKKAGLYLFDEPCSAMDIKYQKDFFQIAQKVKTLVPCSILVTIHDINLAIKNCDRILLFHDGRILYDGAAKEISARDLTKAFETAVSNECDSKPHFYY